MTSQYIKELTEEATEIITNARHAAEDGEITQAQADEVISNLLENIGTAFADYITSPAEEAHRAAHRNEPLA